MRQKTLMFPASPPLIGLRCKRRRKSKKTSVGKKNKKIQPANSRMVVSPTMVSGENSVSVVVGEDVLVEFTLPTETPIYDKLQHSEGDKYAMMIHAVMETSVSGRTIVEVIEGTLMDFDDALKNIVSTDDAITGELKELDGKEVYIFKKLEKEVNTFGAEVCSFEYLVDIPLNENIILQFRIDGAYNPDNTVVFDDSIIDILLSHCVF